MAKYSRKRKSRTTRRTPYKRRRTQRRGRKASAFTSQSGVGGALRFKARKTSRAAYKKHLWDSTLFKEHYRSNAAVSATIVTNTNTNDLNILAEQALVYGAAPFYTAAGGAIQPDIAQPLPLFSGDVIIRGGMLGMRIANNMDATTANTSSIQGTVYLIKTTKNWTAASIPATVRPGWDPTLVPDFDTKVGRILYRRNFLLRDADAAVIEYRLRVEKVDVGDLGSTFNTYVWLVLTGNVDGSISHVLTVTKYHNLSFAADAV